MNPIENFKISIVVVAVLLAGKNLPNRAFAAEPATPTHCAAPSYRQFDFWAGDWDVFDVGSPIHVAHAKVDLILDGCVLREDYQGTDGHKGQSFTIYDVARDVWHQTWVPNRGELLQIEGKLDAGVMILTGEDHTKHTLVRGWWKAMKGEVRETAGTSSDDGKTWKPWFDLAFRPRTSSMSTTPSSAAHDRRIVAALDTQYQAAVEDSDAATMNQILADDFILVTGSGKTYTKADLLAEARSGRVHCERQDDTNQTVRVWDDTAVISEDLGQSNSEDYRESSSANNSAGDAVKTSDSIRLTPASTRVKTARKRHLANCDPAFGDEHGGSD